MKTKKWLASLLTVVMVMSMLPTMVFAADTTDSNVSTEESTSSEVESISSGTTNQEQQTEMSAENGQSAETTAADPAVEPETESEENTDESTDQTNNSDQLNVETTSTLSAKITAAGTTPTTITLTANTNEDIVIPSGADITLEISAGVTLGNVSGDTITNNGTLTVTGQGSVTSTISGKTALLNNGKANLNGSSFSTGNTGYYTVVNHGVMTVAGASITKNSTEASCLENGWYNSEDVSGKTAKLTISSGSITGGMHAVKNDEGGDLTITGGTVSGSQIYTVINYGTANISGGTIENSNTKTGSAAVSNGYINNGVTYSGSMTISGGTFTAGSYAISNASELTIKNGTFNGANSGISTETGSNTVISSGGFIGSKYYGLTTKGNVTITGGSFTGGSSSSGYAVRANGGTDTKIVIEGGSFAAPNGKYTIYQASSGQAISISDDSTFTGGSISNIYKSSKTSSDSIVISGGKFTSSVADYCATGYEQVSISEDPYTYTVGKHELQKVEGKAPTCTESGIEEYWECSTCGKMYSDADGQAVITEPKIITATGHVYGSEWKSDAGSHWHECTCGDKTDAANHTYGDWTVTKAVTETEKGEKQRTCSVCGYSETEEIPVIGVDVQTQIVQTKLTEVPEGLKQTSFNTVEAIEKELTRVAMTNAGYTEENTVVSDVKLQISADGGNTWIDATEENFPASGITILLPYPEGTGKNTHDFVVTHMFTVTSERLGTKAGNTETPTVKKLDNGIQVTLKGLSPVSISWKAVSASTDKPDSSTTSPQTGDSSNMALWFALMSVSVLGIGATVLYGRKRRASR